MGHSRETNLPHNMGVPRRELAGRETGRGIYRGRLGIAGREMGRGIQHRRWDIQGGNWQAGRQEEEFNRRRWMEMGHSRETNLPHDMGLPRPELAGRETGRGIYRGRLGIVGTGR